MKIKKTVVLMSLLFMFSGCAALGIFRTAQYEFDQGLALFNRGKYEEAIPHFGRAIELDPDFARAHLYLGRSHLNLGKWREAIVPLRTAMRLSPDEFKKEIVDVLLDALLHAGLFELKGGNFQESISFFREAFELQPESARAKNELTGALVAYGATLLSQGKMTDAVSAFKEAIQLSPKNFDAYLGLARALISSGDFRGAIKVLQEAAAMEPGNTDLQLLLEGLLRR